MTPQLRSMVTELVDKINEDSSSGLITRDLIILANLVQREMSRKENDDARRSEGTTGSTD
jgi:hypothetical protein